MKSCLIVDDSRVVRKVARRIVEELGFSCEEAEDGKQAYDSCLRFMPDVVLLDWNMPVMTGIEFVEKLRKTKNVSQPRVVFCTTESDASRIRRALDAGADEYIMKPFDADIVRSKFSQVGLIEE